VLRGFHPADAFTTANAACGMTDVPMAMRFLITKQGGDLRLAAALADGARLRRAWLHESTPHVVAWAHVVRHRGRRNRAVPRLAVGLWEIPKKTCARAVRLHHARRPDRDKLALLLPAVASRRRQRSCVVESLLSAALA
jgi:hypothetical protein